MKNRIFIGALLIFLAALTGCSHEKLLFEGRLVGNGKPLARISTCTSGPFTWKGSASIAGNPASIAYDIREVSRSADSSRIQITVDSVSPGKPSNGSKVVADIREVSFGTPIYVK